MRATREEPDEMSTEKVHTCINTVSPMHGPSPCEACAGMPRCEHGMRAGLDKCDSCGLRGADDVVGAARGVAECFTGIGAQMVLSLPGRTLEDRMGDLRAALAVLDKAGVYASTSGRTS